MVAPVAPRSLWHIRLYYLAWIGGGGFLLPFINIFYVRQGLSGAEIGALSALGALISIIVAPLWGRWSDSLADPRRILAIMLVGTGISYLALSQQTTFLTMAAVLTPLSILGAAIAPLSDVLALSLTGAARSGYGSVRLWGSLGWAVLAVGSGWLIERTGLLTAFWGYALSLAAGAVIIAATGSAASPRPARAGAATAGGWRSILGQPVLLGLAVTLTIYMLTNSPQSQFEPVYLNQLGAGESIVGLVSTIGALVELPSMLLADRLIRRYGSERVLAWSFLLRVGLQGLILLAPGVPMLLAMRAVNGLAFSLYTVGVTMLVAERSGAGGRTTAMAVFGVTLPSVVRMASGPLGGWAFDRLGAYYLYAIALAGNALGWLTFRMTVQKGS